MILLDMIGDMVIRRWKRLDTEIKCEHCGGSNDVRLEMNDTSFEYVGRALRTLESEKNE